MELVMLGSNAFAHIVEALILWISMSQMYEPKYKQLFTGCSIFLGHIVMFAVFLTNNIYAITVINLLVYIFLIMLLYDVNKRTAVFLGCYTYSYDGIIRINNVFYCKVYSWN